MHVRVCVCTLSACAIAIARVIGVSNLVSNGTREIGLHMLYTYRALEARLIRVNGITTSDTDRFRDVSTKAIVLGTPCDDVIIPQERAMKIRPENENKLQRK